MGLFDAFKKKPAPLPATGKTYNFINNSNFRGFKRYYLITYKQSGVQEGIDALKKPNPAYKKGGEEAKYIFDLKQAPIEIREGTHSGNNPFLLVFANGQHVGNYYVNTDEEKQLLNDFRNNMIEKVFIRVEWREEVVFLPDKNGETKSKTEERFRSYLYVKRKEK